MAIQSVVGSQIASFTNIRGVPPQGDAPNQVNNQIQQQGEANGNTAAGSPTAQVSNDRGAQAASAQAQNDQQQTGGQAFGRGQTIDFFA